MHQLYFRGNILNRSYGFSWKKYTIDNSHLYEFEEEIDNEYDVFFHDLHMSPLFTLEKTKEIERKSNGKIFKGSGNTWKMIQHGYEEAKEQLKQKPGYSFKQLYTNLQRWYE